MKLKYYLIILSSIDCTRSMTCYALRSSLLSTVLNNKLNLTIFSIVLIFAYSQICRVKAKGHLVKRLSPRIINVEQFVRYIWEGSPLLRFSLVTASRLLVVWRAIKLAIDIIVSSKSYPKIRIIKKGYVFSIFRINLVGNIIVVV